MPTTVLYGDRRHDVQARRSGDDLWLSEPDLLAATGWEIKPEGICRDDVCIPVPPDRAERLVQAEGGRKSLNLSEFTRYIGQPSARDDAHDVWYFGASLGDQRSRLLALEAPDFTLHTLDGTAHTLSDFRNRKVLLAFWSSW